MITVLDAYACIYETEKQTVEYILTYENIQVEQPTKFSNCYNVNVLLALN